MAGSSNGGMFVYDLANDPRMADRLAGIATEIATPHYGYSFGPLSAPMSMVAVHGLADNVVPPVADPTHSEYSPAHPDRTFDTSESGWYYTSAEAVGRYGTFRLNFHRFDRFELDLRGHTRARGAAVSWLRLKLADIVLI